MALMTKAKGTAMIRETIFENRFMHVQELARLGADIHLHGDTAEVRGVQKLTGRRCDGHRFARLGFAGDCRPCGGRRHDDPPRLPSGPRL